MVRYFKRKTYKYISLEKASKTLKISNQEFKELAVLHKIIPVNSKSKLRADNSGNLYYLITDIQKLFDALGTFTLSKRRKTEKIRKKYLKNNQTDLLNKIEDDQFMYNKILKFRYKTLHEAVVGLNESFEIVSLVYCIFKGFRDEFFSMKNEFKNIKFKDEISCLKKVSLENHILTEKYDTENLEKMNTSDILSKNKIMGLTSSSHVDLDVQIENNSKQGETNSVFMKKYDISHHNFTNTISLKNEKNDKIEINTKRNLTFEELEAFGISPRDLKDNFDKETLSENKYIFKKDNPNLHFFNQLFTRNHIKPTIIDKNNIKVTIKRKINKKLEEDEKTIELLDNDKTEDFKHFTINFDSIETTLDEFFDIFRKNRSIQSVFLGTQAFYYLIKLNDIEIMYPQFYSSHNNLNLLSVDIENILDLFQLSLHHLKIMAHKIHKIDLKPVEKTFTFNRNKLFIDSEIYIRFEYFFNYLDINLCEKIEDADYILTENCPENIVEGKKYIVPQYVFDYFNQKTDINIHDYFVGKKPPKHICPFEKPEDLNIDPNILHVLSKSRMQKLQKILQKHEIAKNSD